jgi:3-deoxy-D-manno-octulosonic-acid transferase
LQAALAGRPVWLAASTHEGEEQRLLSVHDTLRLAAPECLLILAPRHPERTADLEASCRMAGARVVRRSSGALPGPADTVWLWDTMGELTLAMALAPVTVMGGSLVEDVGGHNPVEPVAAGSAVISGTKVHNFADLFLDLEAAGGAVLCSDDHALTLALAGLLNDPGRCATMTGAARAVVAEGASAMDRAVAALLPLIRPSVDTKAPPERVP